MMSIELASAVVKILLEVQNRVKNVKVYRRRCQHLMEWCSQLIDALTEGVEDVPTNLDALHQVQAILKRVDEKVENWTGRHKILALIKLDETNQELACLESAIGECMAVYQIKTNTVLARSFAHGVKAAEGDHSEIVNMIREILKLLNSERSNGADVSVVQRAVAEDSTLIDEVPRNANDSEETGNLEENIKGLEESLEKLIPNIVSSQSSRSFSASSPPTRPRWKSLWAKSASAVVPDHPPSAPTPDDLNKALNTTTLMSMCDGYTLRGATLELWIRYLLENPKDTVQRSIFFIGHVAVVSSDVVLHKLESRFDEENECINVTIMCLIRDWLKNEHLVIPNDVLKTMESIADRALNIDGQNFLSKLALDVMKGISNKTLQDFLNSPMMSPMMVESTDGTYDPPLPEELAASLTILEGETHRLILAAEYIAHASQRDRENHACPNLQQAIVFNKAITTWVQISILDIDKIKERSKMMSSFVRTAKECHTIGNYSSMCAILYALKSEEILCLRGTRKHMPKDDLKQLDLLEPLLDLSEYKALKNEYKIPWPDAELRQIKTIMDANYDVIFHPYFTNIPQLNIEKCDLLTKAAMGALCSRHPPVEYSTGVFEPTIAYLQRSIQSKMVGQDIKNLAERREHEETGVERANLQNSGFSGR